MYIPIGQVPGRGDCFVSGLYLSGGWSVADESVTLRAPIEAALRDASGLPVAHVRTMAEIEVRDTARQRSTCPPHHLWRSRIVHGRHWCSRRVS